MLKGLIFTLCLWGSGLSAAPEDPKNPMKYKLPYELPDAN